MMDVLIKMSDGNPGAANILTQLVSNSVEVDPDNFAGPLGTILNLDTQEIYGSRIWMLYKDVCGECITTTIGMSRAVQLGILPIQDLNTAIDNRGRGVIVEQVMEVVRKQLPSFGQ